MHFTCLVSAWLLVGGQIGDRDWTWFQNRAGSAENYAQNSKKVESRQLIDEMQQEAERQKDEEKRLFVQWKKGVCEFYLANYNQSIKTLEAIKDYEKNKVFRHVLYRDLGDAYSGAGQFKHAEKKLQLALDWNEKIIKPLDKGKEANRRNAFAEAELISIRLKQVRCKIGLEDFDAAQQRLASIKPEIKQPNSPEWACLNARWNMLQAGVELHARNTLRALERREDSQKILEEHRFFPEAVNLRFTCHVDQAGVYLLLARFTQAASQLKSAEQVLRSRTPHPRNLASLKNAQAALLIEKTTLAIENDPAAADILESLQEAEKHLMQALDHLDNAEDLLAATVQFQLAMVHELRGRALAFAQKHQEAQGEFKNGMQRCETALKWRHAVFPSHHVVVLETRTLRGWLNLRMGNANDTQKEGHEALKLYDKEHEKTDLDRGRYLHLLFEAENRLGQTDDARKHADEHRRLIDKGLGSLLVGLSAPEQIQFFRKWDHRALLGSLRLGIGQPKNAQLAESSAEWLINGKAKLTEVLAAQVKTAKAGDQNAFVKFQAAVQRQAYLLYGEPTANIQTLQSEYLMEEAYKRDFAETAAQRFPRQLRWYKLQEVRDSLAADELYVGLYSLRPQDDAKRQYYAWVVPPRGQVRIVSLGDAERIDFLAKCFLREQEKVPFIAPGQEKNAEQELRDKCLTELSRLILHPIHKIAGGKTRWIVSPDGPLWNVPWAALLLPDGNRYAIEELNFRYAVSGQDLVREPAQPGGVGAPLVLGDPWFNHPNTDPKHLRKHGLDPLRIPWDRLAFSKEECETVLAILENARMKPSRIRSIMDKDQLLELKRPPQIVYLSTHAYVSLPSKLQTDDPLLSCALAFAGWNYLPPDRKTLPGMMTGTELLAIDLRGTELVVLASCQAGTDLASSSQSPANLRHAFHLAGARSVVSALWGIQDKSTLALLGPFMESMGQPNTDKMTALRDAQQQSIRYLRMYRDHAHPYYWAGFTISGG